MILLLLILLIQNSVGDIPDDLLKGVELQHEKFSTKFVEYQREYNKTKNSIEEYCDSYLKVLLKEIVDMELNRMRIDYESQMEAQICRKNLNEDMKVLVKTYDFKQCYPEIHYVNILRRFQKFRASLEEFKEIGTECLKDGHENLEKCFRGKSEGYIRTLDNLGFDIKHLLEGAFNYTTNCLWMKIFNVQNDATEMSFKYFKCVYEQPGVKID